MIPFYRKIRYRLAKDNQFLKYSRYAIGEIVLVVIGILIAISINNWNEERKNKVVELEILKNLKNAFDSDIEKTIKANILACEQRIRTTNELISAAKVGQVRIDAIQGITNLSAQMNFRNVTLPLKILESKGLDIIQDKELKYTIVNIYAEDYSYIKMVYQNEFFNQRDLYRPVMNQYFKKVMHDNKMEIQIVDESNMLKDQTFMNAIITMNQNNLYLKKILEDLMFKLTLVIEKIDKVVEA